MATLNAAERMLKNKKALINRLRIEISDVRLAAQQEEAINGRIRIAQTLVDALEKGTLKP